MVYVCTNIGSSFTHDFFSLSSFTHIRLTGKGKTTDITLSASSTLKKNVEITTSTKESSCKDIETIAEGEEQGLPITVSPQIQGKTINQVHFQASCRSRKDDLTNLMRDIQKYCFQTFTQDDLDKSGSLDDSILSTPIFSASAKNDISPASHKTPAKRSVGKHQPLENTHLESQFSMRTSHHPDLTSSLRSRRSNLKISYLHQDFSTICFCSLICY
ncbi:unnamed protein product [Trifolium pratense]|uniref:Uncharacterized protein n=1 Tax=Trifolium pratense TaxID=57577 RepID=A0ACB0IAN6_TRIPR|nr:unnamed protein product [Trifolium pratense]